MTRRTKNQNLKQKVKSRIPKDWLSEIRITYRIAIETVKGIAQTGLVNIAIITTIAAILTIFGSIFRVTLAVNSFVSSMGSALEVSAYLSQDADMNNQAALELNQLPADEGIEITLCQLLQRYPIDSPRRNLAIQTLYRITDYIASSMSPAYRNLQNRQIVSVGVRIPILDWGKGKGRVELAKSQADVENNRVQQEMMDFEQSIMLAVQQYQDQQGLTAIYREADTVAQQRYKTTFDTFVMGQISVLDINAAQSEKEQAKRNYINQLYMSWLCFYNLRQITLFDFLTKTDIEYSLQEK